MKVFATLATILGVAYATPDAQIHSLGQMGSMQSNLNQQHSNAMPKMRMSVQSYQGQTSPNQYHLQDKLGNFEYAYANQDSQKMEKGNNMSVRGRYAYVMSNGVLRRVEYIADNNGFHVLQDNADNSKAQDRTKRSVEPDLIQTRMTSAMDSTSLRDNSMANPNMYNAMMGQDMSSNMMQRDGMERMSSDRAMYSMKGLSNNMMGRNMMSSNMRGQNIYSNMMGRDQSSNMMGHEMSANLMGRDDMSTNMLNQNMMGQQGMSASMMNTNMMGRVMSSNMRGQNIYSDMMGHDQSSNMMGRQISANMMNQNMMGRQDMTSSMMNTNMMGHNMYSGPEGQGMHHSMSGQMNTYTNDVNQLPLGQRNTMSQRMEIEQIPRLTGASHQLF